MELDIDEMKHIADVSFSGLKEFISSNQVTENDTLLLSELDWDTIVLEHRPIYEKPLMKPFYLLGVLIDEAPIRTFEQNCIGIVRNDWGRRRAYEAAKNAEEKRSPKETVYRCGYCGDLVDYDGGKLSAAARAHKSNIWREYGDDVLGKTHGQCCREEYQAKNENENYMRQVKFTTKQQAMPEMPVPEFDKDGSFHQFGTSVIESSDGQIAQETVAIIEDNNTGEVYKIAIGLFRFKTSKEITNSVLDIISKKYDNVEDPTKGW